MELQLIFNRTDIESVKSIDFELKTDDVDNPEYIHIELAGKSYVSRDNAANKTWVTCNSADFGITPEQVRRIYHINYVMMTLLSGRTAIETSSLVSMFIKFN